MRIAVLVLVLGGCTDHIADERLAYAWDDRRILCSAAVDDLVHDLNWNAIENELQLAQKHKYVALYHAHTPGTTVTMAALDRLFTLAEKYQLTSFTYRELEPGPPKPGIALAFDDNAPDQWFMVRDLLAQHSAKVTFFVARYTQMTPLGHEELQMLWGDGHDVEPHTVNHLHGPAYVAQYGIDAYMNNEVLPSFQVLEDAGYPSAAAFAYPFGDRTPEMDKALLQVVGKVRTTVDPCPWK
jgi:hypothetical protein